MIVVSGEQRIWIGAQANLLPPDDSRLMAWAENHVRRDKDLKWILGNFVEADNANHNGHIFPLEDLKASIASIPTKPLNMLHHGNYIVGAFAASEFVEPSRETTGTGPQNTYIEALSAFWHNFFPNEYALVEKAHKEGTLFYCVDEETELLTAGGWKRHGQLVEGEEILTLDTATGLSQWTPLERVHRYELDGEDVVRMEGMMHSSVTTPNHRWWVEQRNQGWQWRTTETLTTGSRIPRAVPHGDFPVVPKYSDALVELAAWFWTEGTDCGSGGVIYQSHAVNPLNCDRIAAALLQVFGTEGRVSEGGLWYQTTQGRMTYFHLCRAAMDVLRELGGKVPSSVFLRALTQSQLRLWVDVSLLGDGDNARSGQLGIKQKSIEGVRSFEMACALLGVPTNTSRCSDGMWRVGLVQRSNRVSPLVNARRDRGFTVTRESFVGTVWCPQTPAGTFLARRRGTVYWTGNSMECDCETLTCKVDGGCGQTFPFSGARSDKYCAHLQKVGASKQINKPWFNAGALIVPPVKPGWSKADIRELAVYMKEHADVAEKLYAGFEGEASHLGPKEWEELMAQVVLTAKEFSGDKRKKLAKEGKARSDGSFPIESVQDLKNAIQAIGRAKNPAAAKAHIKRRARALGLFNLVPADWK